MGELDIAQIRAMFERDSRQADQLIVGLTPSSEKRVVATLGLSPGALSTNRSKPKKGIPDISIPHLNDKIEKEGPVQTRKRQNPSSNRDSLVQSTIEKEMQIITALQAKASVPSLIRRFSTAREPEKGTKHVSNGEEDLSKSYEEDAALEPQSKVTSDESSWTASEGYDDYSCEAKLDTEHQEYLEASSFASHTSSSLDFSNHTSNDKNKIILDLEEMEPPSPVKEMHLKVIADLQALMKKSRNRKETEKQQKMKEKMLRDLIITSRTWGIDSSGHHLGIKKADLTVDEVSDIVTHINMCEQANLPIRWDLINDIVFPNEIEEEPDEEDCTGRKEEDQNSNNNGQMKGSSKVSFSSTTEVFNSSGKTPSKVTRQVEPEIEPVEMFRHHYNLSEDEMADILNHLTLCEETGTPIRWDLIHRIIYPEETITTSFLQEEENADADEVRSAITDGFDDNESRVSWFSIYPEFEDCASSVTFLVDGDDVKIGKRSSRKKSGDPSFVPPKPSSVLTRANSDSSGISRSSLLLRKRVKALQIQRSHID